MEICTEFWWGNIIQVGVGVTVSLLNGLWLGQRGGQYPPRARDFYFFVYGFRQAVGPTQCPIQWVPEVSVPWDIVAWA